MLAVLQHSPEDWNTAHRRVFTSVLCLLHVEEEQNL